MRKDIKMIDLRVMQNGDFMSTETVVLDEKLYSYLLSISLREHPVLSALREETQKLSNAQMQISPEQGQFMAFLLELMNAKKILELGTFTGYSALVMALALPEDGKLITCDIDPKATDVAKRYWQKAGVDNKIDLRLAPCLETFEKLLSQGEAQSFDFIFIDADKNNYLNYYEQGLKLLRKGGVIAIDNVLWSGRVADADDQDERTKSIRKLNQYVFEDERVTVSVVPMADGLSLVRKR